MSAQIEKKIRAVVGNILFYGLMKFVKLIRIKFDAADETIIINRGKSEPVRFKFKDVEDFVNNVH